jgi:hypothetical protein
MSEISSIDQQNSIPETPVMVEVLRKYSLTPPFCSFTERIFSTEALALEFQSLQATINELEQAREVFEKMDAVNKKIIQQKNDELAVLSKREKHLQRFEKEVIKIRKENTKLSQALGNLQSTHRQLQSDQTQLSNQLKSANRRAIESEQKATSVKEEFLQYKIRNEREMTSLRGEIEAKDAQLARSKKVLELIPKVRTIPYGVERVLERGGFEVSAPSQLPSHPPLTGKPVPYARPTLTNPKWNVRGLCMAKDRENVKTSQDALSFDVRHGTLYVGISDGVSTSHRQSEWAHRLALAALHSSPIEGIALAAEHHASHAKTMLELVDPKLRWMEEQMIDKSSEATLLCVHDTGEQTVTLKRRGDVWAAAMVNGAWTIVMEPSKVAATTAFSSKQASAFDDELEISRPQRMLVMTDGVHPTNPEGLASLWEGLHIAKEDAFNEWIAEADRDEVFDRTDDVSILGIEMKP